MNLFIGTCNNKFSTNNVQPFADFSIRKCTVQCSNRVNIFWNWYHYQFNIVTTVCLKKTQQSEPVSNGELTSLSATDSRGRDGGLWGGVGVRGRHTSLRCRAQTDVFVDRRFIYSRRGFATARGDSFETVFFVVPFLLIRCCLLLWM